MADDSRERSLGEAKLNAAARGHQPAAEGTEGSGKPLKKSAESRGFGSTFNRKKSTGMQAPRPFSAAMHLGRRSKTIHGGAKRKGLRSGERTYQMKRELRCGSGRRILGIE